MHHVLPEITFLRWKPWFRMIVRYVQMDWKWPIRGQKACISGSENHVLVTNPISALVAVSIFSKGRQIDARTGIFTSYDRKCLEISPQDCSFVSIWGLKFRIVTLFYRFWLGILEFSHHLGPCIPADMRNSALWPYFTILWHSFWPTLPTE